MEGFKYHFKKKNLCTVWSAPNYCYRCGNKASMLKIDKSLSRTIEYFDFSEKSLESQPPKLWFLIFFKKEFKEIITLLNKVMKFVLLLILN